MSKVGLARSLAVLVCAWLVLDTGQAAAAESQEVFTANRSALYQIKVLDIPSGDRTALGSGFAVSEHIVATNYHVISSYIESPQRVSIEIVDYQQGTQAVEIVAVDVVNDLALLRNPVAMPHFLELATKEPTQGTLIFALGNPFDLGMSVTQGIYNGVREHSLPPRIHYSGPVNSGMSGGPSVDAQGGVVGINVATANNSVGFLIPVEKLATLLQGEWDTALSEAGFAKQMTAQLTQLQARYMAGLTQGGWQTETFGGALVPGRIAPFVDCWGRSAEPDKTGVTIISRGCSNGRQVHVNRSLTTSFVEYEFSYLSTDTLSPMRLYNFAASRFRGARPGNKAGSDDVTNYECSEEHVQTGDQEFPPGRTRVIFCTRAYLDFEGLYDAFYVSFSVDREDQILFSHFTLAGFSRDNTLEFLDRFLRSVRWPSS